LEDWQVEIGEWEL